MTDSIAVLPDASNHRPPPSSRSLAIAPASTRRGWRSWLAWIAVVLVVLGVLSGVFVLGERPRRLQAAALAAATAEQVSARPRVRAVVPRSAPPTESLRLPGTVEPARTTGVFARVGGIVAERLVDLGDQVVAGQVLAVIDAPELTQQRARGEALLALARAGVEQATVELRRARLDYERARKLDNGLLSKQDVEHRLAEQDAAAANLQAAIGKVAAEEADLARLQQEVAFTRVTAPFAGVITGRSVEVGNLVPGGGGTTALFHLAQLDPLRVVVEVPQASVAGIEPGLAASISTVATSATITGTVVRVARALDAERRAMRVEIEFPQTAAPRLAPGMRIQAMLSVPAARPLLLIPADAVLLSAKGTQVAVLDRDARVHLVPVTVAWDSGNEIAISAGLGLKDRVIANPAGTIAEGTLVEVVVPPAPKPASQATAPSATKPSL